MLSSSKLSALVPRSSFTTPKMQTEAFYMALLIDFLILVLTELRSYFLMITSLSFWSMSPCIADLLKSLSRIFPVSQSTLRLVLEKMTAWVIVRVSYRSHKVAISCCRPP